MREVGYCSNPPCGVGPVMLFATQCRACYQWSYRHDGALRPEAVVMRNASRTIDRMQRSQVLSEW